MFIVCKHEYVCVKHKTWSEESQNILKYFELNANENVICGNMWSAVKAVLQGKFTALNVHIRKEETPEINYA